MDDVEVEFFSSFARITFFFGGRAEKSIRALDNFDLFLSRRFITVREIHERHRVEYTGILRDEDEMN